MHRFPVREHRYSKKGTEVVTPTDLVKNWTKLKQNIGGSRGACLWDPILLFLHTFSPKSAHVGGPRPL